MTSDAKLAESTRPALAARPRPLASMAWKGLRLAAVIYCLWLVGACFTQRRGLFPSHVIAAPTRAGFELVGGEQAWLETDEGRVEWWFFPQPDATPQQPAPVLVYAHGNAELIYSQEAEVVRYRELGFHVVLCEYRGYGNSEGSASQRELVEDQVRVLDLVLQRPDADRTRLLYHGRSLGTGVVCALALERPPRALVLSSPFASVREIMSGFGVPGFLCFDPFDNIAALAELHLPTLIFHGDMDRTIPIEHARELAAVHELVQLEVCAGRHHTNVPILDPPARERIGAFAAACGLIDAK